MVERATYKSIRDQLISLSVDIEDKTKICALLEKKIDHERSLLAKVEGSVNEEYDAILEVNRTILILYLFAWLKLTILLRFLQSEIKNHKEYIGHKTSATQKVTVAIPNIKPLHYLNACIQCTFKFPLGEAYAK